MTQRALQIVFFFPVFKNFTFPFPIFFNAGINESILLFFCRWAKLRAAMIPSTILMEPLTECMLLGLLTAWAVSFLLHWDPITFFFVHIAVWFIMDAILIRVVQNGPLPFNKLEFLVRFSAVYFASCSLSPVCLLSLLVIT